MYSLLSRPLRWQRARKRAMVKHAGVHVLSPVMILPVLLPALLPVIHAPSPRAKLAKHVLPVLHVDPPAVRARVRTPAGTLVRLTVSDDHCSSYVPFLFFYEIFCQQFERIKRFQKRF